MNDGSANPRATDVRTTDVRTTDVGSTERTILSSAKGSLPRILDSPAVTPLSSTTADVVERAPGRKEAFYARLSRVVRRVPGLVPGLMARSLSSPAAHAGLTLTGLLTIWYLVTVLARIPKYMLPSPMAVAEAFGRYSSLLLIDASATVRNALIGLGIAVILAVVLAVALVHSRILQNMIMPVIVGIEAMPKIAFAPLLVVWLGIGAPSKVAVATMIAFFPILINLRRGLQEVDPQIIAVCKVLKAEWWKVLLYVRFPNSLVSLFDGLRIALPGAMIGSILGEYIASEEGLGHRILISNAALRTDLVFAALILIGVISMIGFQILGILERRVVTWRER